MDYEMFLATKEDYYRRFQELARQIFKTAGFELDNIHLKQGARLPEYSSKNVVNLYSVANRYIQAVDADEFNDKLEMIKMKLLNPKLYRFWSDLSDLYIEVTGSMNTINSIHDDVLDSLGNRIRRAKVLYYKDYTSIDFYFEQVEQIINEKHQVITPKL